MPLIALQIKANLVNVTEIRPYEIDDFRWHLKLKCSNCGTQPNHWQYVVFEDKIEVSNSRGSANLVEKCKECKRQNSLDIVRDSFRAYNSDNQQYQTIVVFECRGIEPTEFDFRNGWYAAGSRSTSTFTDIDLTEKEWADYDAIIQEPVEITDIASRFVPHSKK